MSESEKRHREESGHEKKGDRVIGETVRRDEERERQSERKEMSERGGRQSEMRGRERVRGKG